MNKLFALSLLLLSSCIAYGMEKKSCCKHGASAQNCNNKTELEECAVDVDVEINLPEDFKSRLYKNSQTAFTINYDADHYSVLQDILGLRVNKKGRVKVCAAKEDIGIALELVKIAALYNKSTADCGIKLHFEHVDIFKKDPIIYNTYCLWNNKTSITIPNVGFSIDNKSDKDFKPTDIEIKIMARKAVINAHK